MPHQRHGNIGSVAPRQGNGRLWERLQMLHLVLKETETSGLSQKMALVVSKRRYSQLACCAGSSAFRSSSMSSDSYPAQSNDPMSRPLVPRRRGAIMPARHMTEA